MIKDWGGGRKRLETRKGMKQRKRKRNKAMKKEKGKIGKIKQK